MQQIKCLCEEEQRRAMNNSHLFKDLRLILALASARHFVLLAYERRIYEFKITSDEITGAFVTHNVDDNGSNWWTLCDVRGNEWSFCLPGEQCAQDATLWKF